MTFNETCVPLKFASFWLPSPLLSQAEMILLLTPPWWTRPLPFDLLSTPEMIQTHSHLHREGLVLLLFHRLSSCLQEHGGVLHVGHWWHSGRTQQHKWNQAVSSQGGQRTFNIKRIRNCWKHNSICCRAPPMSPLKNWQHRVSCKMLRLKDLSYLHSCSVFGANVNEHMDATIQRV